MGCTEIPFFIEFPVLLPDSCYASVDELESNAFEMYPNPAAINVHVGILSKQKSSTELKVFDVTGRNVFQQSMKQVGNDISINVSQFPNGIYLVSISTENGHQHSGRLVVQHE